MALTRPRYSQIYDTDYKQSVRVATTGDVGNLLATGNMTNTIDGKSLAVADRILVKDQSDAKQNGIYRVATVGTGSNGTWIRATDADANDKVTSGMTTTVAEGDTHISKTFKLSTPDPITVGVTGLTFINPFVAGSAAGSNTQIQFNDDSVSGASAGLTFNKTGNVLSVGGNINVTGSILPSANVTYDLGSPTQRWRDGWFSGTTIHIGTESMSVGTDGTWAFTSGGATVELGVAADFNPPNANISGNVTATNYLFANNVPLMTVVNTMVSTANTGMQGHVAEQISTANVNLKGYVDAANTIQSNQISGANSAITTANTNMKGYVDGQISTTTTAITTANTNMKGYVDSIDSTKANLSGASFTGNISVPYIVNGLKIDGNLNISGNLNVAGIETVFNTNNLNITDSLIYLADNNTGDVLDIGFVSAFTNGGYQHTGLVRDAGDGVWKLFANVVAEPTTTVDFTNATYSNLRVGNLITSTVTYANGQSILTNVESAITTANTNMKGYVDGQISTTTSTITTANTNMKGYVDAANTIQSGQISTTSSAITTANTNMKGYVDGQISTTTSAITTANTNMKGYVDANITTVNNSLAGANATMVTSVTGTAPVTSSGGKTPAISMAAATASVNGYMTSTYASKLDGIAANATNVTNTNQLTNGNAFVTASVTLTTAAQTNITSVGTLTSLTVSGVSLLGGYSQIAGSSSFVGIKYPGGGTQYGIGLQPAADSTNAMTFFNAAGTVLGAISQTVNTLTFSGTASTAKYADLAEIYRSDRNYIPGTVVVFGGTSEVTVSLTSHDPTVAGVVSTNPAYLMNDQEDGSAVALQGRVPCRVLGPVSRGDRVVTSDVRGVAERLDMDKYQPGCIIGKALGSIPDGEIATIEVVVGRN